LLLLRLTAPLGIALLLLVLQFAADRFHTVASVVLLGHTITVTREGWHNGVLMASRVSLP